MNGGDIKKAAITKAKQMASSAAAVNNATNGNNAGKKRRKGTDLRPIVTNESAPSGVAVDSIPTPTMPASASKLQGLVVCLIYIYIYVHMYITYSN